MAITFISLSPHIQQAKQNEEAKQKSDVAAVVANKDDDKIKKQGSNRADVAAVLAMSEQPPIQEGQRDLCLA